MARQCEHLVTAARSSSSRFVSLIRGQSAAARCKIGGSRSKALSTNSVFSMNERQIGSREWMLVNGPYAPLRHSSGQVIAPIPRRSDGDRANCAASAPAQSRVRRNARSPRWAGSASGRRGELCRLPPHRSGAPIPRHRGREEVGERGARPRSREENRRWPSQHR